MKRFLVNIVIFAFVAFITAIVFDYMISTGLRKIERYNFNTINKIMNNNLNADVVILGNSRAQESYHPLVLDTILKIDSWNLGIRGQPFGVSYLRWQVYKRNNNNPKLLIVNVDYKDLEMVNNGFDREQYYPYIKDTLVKPYLDLYGFSWAEQNVPMYRYRGNYKIIGIGLLELLHLRHDTKGSYSYIKGFYPSTRKWDGKNLEDVLSKGKVQDVCNPKATALLADLLEEANKDGTSVVFVYAPLYKRLKDNLDENASKRIYQQLSEKYEVPILDFTDMSICTDTNYFYDANHLNYDGALRFSVEFAHCIDSLGVLQN